MDLSPSACSKALSMDWFDMASAMKTSTCCESRARLRSRLPPNASPHAIGTTPSFVWARSSVVPRPILTMLLGKCRAASPALPSQPVCRVFSAFSPLKRSSRRSSGLAQKWATRVGKRPFRQLKWRMCSPNCRGKVKMGTRRKARELAVQLLYQHDLAKMDPDEAISLFWEHFPVNLNIRAFCEQLVLGTLDRLTWVDELLSEASE